MMRASKLFRHLLVTFVLAQNCIITATSKHSVSTYGPYIESLEESLVERQAGDGSSGSTAGNSGGVPGATTQTQNITNTAGANSNPGNGTNTQASGYIVQPTDSDSYYVNCSDITTGRANKCWDELQLTEFVQQWSNTHKCYEDEGFSTCYLRQNGFPSLDCSAIYPSACVAPQSDNLFANPKNFYVRLFRTNSCMQATFGVSGCVLQATYFKHVIGSLYNKTHVLTLTSRPGCL